MWQNARPQKNRMEQHVPKSKRGVVHSTLTRSIPGRLVVLLRCSPRFTKAGCRDPRGSSPRGQRFAGKRRPSLYDRIRRRVATGGDLDRHTSFQRIPRSNITSSKALVSSSFLLLLVRHLLLEAMHLFLVAYDKICKFFLEILSPAFRPAAMCLRT